MLLAILELIHAWPIVGVCVKLVVVDCALQSVSSSLSFQLNCDAAISDCRFLFWQSVQPPEKNANTNRNEN
jgi:hypothetical protein